MRKVALFLTLLFCMSPIFAMANEPPQIAVYVTGGISENEKRVLGTMILSSLVNSGRYMGIERSEAFLAEIEREHETQRSGAIDDGQISALGRQFGVRYVCVADITNAFGAFQLSARIIDVETAVVVFIGEAIIDHLNSARELRQVSNELVNNMFRGQPAPDQPAQRQARQPRPAPEPAPPPPPQTYTLTVRRNPEVGGTVTISPEQQQYDAGTRITAIAAAADGFNFAGWTGASRSQNDSITIIINNNATLTARFREEKPPQVPRPTPEGNFVERHRLQIQISTGALAGVGIIGGMIFNGRANDEFDKYMAAQIGSDAERTARNNTESNVSTRNLLYTLGLLGAAGIIVTCTSFDFDSKFDGGVTPPDVGDNTVTFYCPNACTAQTGTSMQSGCFSSRSACEASITQSCTRGVNCNDDVGRCTASNGTCTNNVRRDNCNGTFVYNSTCSTTPSCTPWQGSGCPTDQGYCAGACTLSGRSGCSGAFVRDRPSSCGSGGGFPDFPGCFWPGVGDFSSCWRYIEEGTQDETACIESMGTPVESCAPLCNLCGNGYTCDMFFQYNGCNVNGGPTTWEDVEIISASL